MTTNTTTPRDFVADWLAAHQGPRPKASSAGYPGYLDSVTALQSATLIATLRPGAPGPVLAAQIATVAAAAAKLGTHRFPLLRELATDARFPGWARLRIAVEIPAAQDLVEDLERYTVPLLANVGTLFNAPGLRYLPPLRRVQLATKYGHRGAGYSITELAAATPTLTDARWTSDPQVSDRLAEGVDWDPSTTFAEAYQVVAGIEFGTATGSLRRALVCALARHTRAADLEELTAAFAATFGTDPVPQLRTDHYTASEVAALLSAPDLSTRQVGVALVSHHVSTDAAVQDALAVAPEAGPALARQSWTPGQAFTMVRRRVSTLGLDAASCRLLTKHRDHLRDPQLAEAVDVLVGDLGPDAWVLGYLTVPALAAQHGYGTAFARPSDLVRDLVCRAEWLAGTPRHREVLTWLPALPDSEFVDDALDKARAVLAGEYISPEARFVPTGMLTGTNDRLVKEVAQQVAYSANRVSRDFASAEEMVEHQLAWLRHLPARDVANLLDQVADLLRLHGPRPPVAVQRYLEEVFATVTTDQTAAALGHAVHPDGEMRWATALPKSMTLGQFAQALEATARRRS